MNHRGGAGQPAPPPPPARTPVRAEPPATGGAPAAGGSWSPCWRSSTTNHPTRTRLGRDSTPPPAQRTSHRATSTKRRRDRRPAVPGVITGEEATKQEQGRGSSTLARRLDSRRARRNSTPSPACSHPPSSPVQSVRDGVGVHRGPPLEVQLPARWGSWPGRWRVIPVTQSTRGDHPAGPCPTEIPRQRTAAPRLPWFKARPRGGCEEMVGALPPRPRPFLRRCPDAITTKQLSPMLLY